MATSNGSSEFVKALIAAKKEFKPLVKNKENPHFKSKYADLASLHDSVDEALAKHGFLVGHVMAFDAGGHYVLRTTLEHVNGGERVSDWSLPAGGKAQEVAAFVTYGRRIGLSSLLGIPAEDDTDGNDTVPQAPSKPTDVRKPLKMVRTPSPPAQEPLVVPDKPITTVDPSDDRIWETATVKVVSEKVGETVDKNGKPKKWNRYGVLLVLQDGSEQWTNTFDKDFGSVASSLQGGGLARVSLKEGKPWNGKSTFDLVGIEPLGEEEVAF